VGIEFIIGTPLCLLHPYQEKVFIQVLYFLFSERRESVKFIVICLCHTLNRLAWNCYLHFL